MEVVKEGQNSATEGMTLPALIASYRTDVDSPYRKLRYHTRQHYDVLCKRIGDDFGDRPLSGLKAREFLHWNEAIVAAGHVPMAHALVGMVRTLVNFGATILEDEQCERISGILSKMRFKMGKSRNERLTAAQANDIRRKAWEAKKPSIALAQAFQFECMLRQKDVIGEWVPESEPGKSGTVVDGYKWLRGLLWEEIDADFILTHTTSKRQKDITVDLKLAPMIVEELNYAMGLNAIGGLQRDKFPSSGPVIFAEADQLPWDAAEFRRQWRKIADACGVPKTVRNMDSRAGAISEATDAGADLEHVRQAATHSDIGMTQKYSRGTTEKVAGVMKLRAEHRNKAVG
jgi:hypothetical protein